MAHAIEMDLIPGPNRLSRSSVILDTLSAMSIFHTGRSSFFVLRESDRPCLEPGLAPPAREKSQVDRRREERDRVQDRENDGRNLDAKTSRRESCLSSMRNSGTYQHESCRHCAICPYANADPDGSNAPDEVAMEDDDEQAKEVGEEDVKKAGPLLSVIGRPCGVRNAERDAAPHRVRNFSR